MSTLRIRSIHHDALRSRKLAALTAEAERCWWRLQCMCDDDGRTEDEPDVIASVLFQVMREVSPEDVDGWLAEMAGQGLIVRYSDAEGSYLAVVGWHDKQKPRRPETSRLPAPPSVPVGAGPSSSDLVATSPDTSRHVPQEGLGVGEVRRGEGGESEGRVQAPPSSPQGLAAYEIAARHANGSTPRRVPA